MLKKSFLLIVLLLVGMGTAVSAQEANRAALIIRLEDGQAVSRCVEFSEAEISGYELLERSGLGVATAVAGGMGSTVCSIENQGCPADDCFCQCKGGGDCLYWSYWHLKEGEWNYSQAGAGSYRVHDGDAQGWSWGIGTPNEAIEPPLLTFDEVCAAQTVSVEQLEPTAAPAADIANEPLPQNDSWMGYAIFGIAILGLGGFLVIRRR
ncbi:MAG: LPXTG cell wall anchor domain-containing protein [Chloroflexi bacterium]|nr:LPXTG cell wall anchor domain-containing protein [Chloroflexota bacterium]